MYAKTRDGFTNKQHKHVLRTPKKRTQLTFFEIFKLMNNNGK